MEALEVEVLDLVGYFGKLLHHCRCPSAVQQRLEASVFDQRRQHAVTLVPSPAEWQRLMVVEHLLQVWWRLLTRRSKVESAKARVAFVDEHKRFVESEGLPDLELAWSAREYSTSNKKGGRVRLLASIARTRKPHSKDERKLLTERSLEDACRQKH